MEIATAGLAAPRHVPDLRPAADAAATPRESMPPAALAFAEVSPPTTVQAATIARAVIATTPVDPADRADKAERRLVPFGIEMLPRQIEQDADPAAPPDETATAGLEVETEEGRITPLPQDWSEDVPAAAADAAPAPEASEPEAPESEARPPQDRSDESAERPDAA
jgi:hypothetical protein